MKSRFSFKFKCFSSALLLGGLGLSLSSPVHAQVVSLYDNNVMVDLSALDGPAPAAAAVPSPLAAPRHTGGNLPPLSAPKSQFLGVPSTLQAPSNRAVQPQNAGKIVLRNPATSANRAAPTSSIAQTAAATKPATVPAPVMAKDTASASLIKFKDDAPAEKKMQPKQPAPKQVAKVAPKPAAPQPKAPPAPKPAKPAVKMTKPEPVVAQAPTPPAPVAQPPKPKAAPVKPVEVAMAPKAPVTPKAPEPEAPKAPPVTKQAPAPAPEAKQMAEAPSAPRAITPPPPPPVSASAPEAPTAPVVKASETQETMTKPQEPAKAKAVAALPPADQSDIRIRFDAAQSRLPDTALGNLRTLADQMRDNEDQRVQLLSYAGGEDLSASKARRLSLSRALAVRSYLIGQGVRSTRIDVRALGNKTTEQPFDRVDIKITDR